MGISSENILFQPGRFVELNFAQARPSVDGVLGGTNIANIGEVLTFLQGGVKTSLTESFDIAFQAREPIQLSLQYPVDPALGGLSGLSAELNGVSFQLLGRYHLNETVSIFGGPRYQTVTGDFFFGPGLIDLERDGGFGFTAGLAYENRKQGLRATLTYQSEINHLSETTSAFSGETTVSQATPRSLRLHLGKRVAPKTALFGGVQWSNSSDANLTIDNSSIGNIATSDFRDTLRFDVVVGRILTKKFRASLSGSYQNGNGEPSGNIFPTNGRTTLELGGRYQAAKHISLSGGFGYTFIGDATAISGAVFENNHSLLFRTGMAVQF